MRRVHVSQHLAAPYGGATPRPAAPQPSLDDAESSADPSPVAPDPGEAWRQLLRALWAERRVLGGLWLLMVLAIALTWLLARLEVPAAVELWRLLSAVPHGRS